MTTDPFPQPAKADHLPDPVPSPDSASGAGRYVPLLVWIAVIVTPILIALKVVSYGIIPAGDLQRHVAHAFTDRPYTDLLLLRPEYVMNHSPGWELLLKGLHRAAGFGRDALTSFSIIVCLLAVLMAPLRWLSRPEAWMGAVLALLIAIPGYMWRLTQGRPYLVTEGLLIMVLAAWARHDDRKPGAVRGGLTAAAVALSVWMHGTWYLWALPLAAFVLARRLVAARWLALCIAAGVAGGAVLTGRPITFLVQAVTIARLVSAENLRVSQLVGEFQPSNGEISFLLVLGLVFLWWKNEMRPGLRRMGDPLFWQFLICWILGLYMVRFFSDWAVPAALVWLALRGQEMMTRAWPAHSWNRVLATLLLCGALYVHSTRDNNEIYTFSRSTVFLNAGNPELKEWFPGPGGVFYSNYFGFFFNTFYENPQGHWRYALGMEPALMREEDRRTYRAIQETGRPSAYEPWIRKMGPADRLVLYRSAQPPLPQLEWKQAAPGVWIGRKPTGNAPAADGN